MGKEYKLVELTEEEIKKHVRPCGKCVANNDYVLCRDLPNCAGTTRYFIEVETDDK